MLLVCNNAGIAIHFIGVFLFKGNDLSRRFSLNAAVPIGFEVVRITQIIQELAEKCLKTKWIASQLENLRRINSPCAFCHEKYTRGASCAECHCPQALCDKEGKAGLLGNLNRKYGDISLCDIAAEDYQLALRVLRDLQATGTLSETTMRKLHKYR